jgi:hypothetical protein
MDQGGFSWTNPDVQPVEQPPSGPSRRQIGMVAMATLAIAVGLLAFTVLGANNGGKGGALSPIAQAAEKTSGFPDGRLRMTVSATGSLLPSPIEITMNGAFNGATGESQTSFSVSGPPPLSTVAGTAVVSGNSYYLRSPSLPVPGGKVWMHLPLQAVGQSDTSVAETTNQLDDLKSVSDSVTLVGQEQVRGESTRHYASNLSLDKAADLLGGLGFDDESDQVLAKIADRAAVDDFPLNVWIDERGLVRRLTFSLAIADDSGGTGSIGANMEFFGFGSKPKIAVPPAYQVYEAPPELLDSLSS